jgi:hypothetical protein
LNNVISNEPVDFSPALNTDGAEPQFPQNDMTDGAKGPANIAETLTPTSLAGPEEDETMGRDLSQMEEESSAQEDRRVIPSSKFTSRSQDTEDDQINKRSRNAKGPKRTAPSAKPVKSRPPRTARDRSRH